MAELPRSPPELEARFPDGAACASWPLAKRWPDGFPFPVHPHVLRCACGFELANDGKDTRALQERLGHSNIQHTELTSKWFKNFWEGED
jgi:integrase